MDLSNAFKDTKKSIIKEVAAKLNNRHYLRELTRAEIDSLKNLDIVVVYGQSDDTLIFEGAISKELDIYDKKIFYITDYLYIKTFWKAEGYSWKLETNLPHAEFDIMEDVGYSVEKYCAGIVFDFNLIKNNLSDIIL